MDFFAVAKVLGDRPLKVHNILIVICYTFYTACYPTDGQTFTFPEIENDNIKNYFYYFASKNCLRIDACLDVTVEELNITKTFSSSIELLPCSFQAVVRIEKWSKTVYLIDFDWGKC